MKIKIINILEGIANGDSWNDYKIKFNGSEPEEISEDLIYDKLYEKDIDLNTEVEIILKGEYKTKKAEKVAIGFYNLQEDSMGWTYIEEGSCKYYIPVALVNRLTSLAEAVNYLLEKEGE